MKMKLALLAAAAILAITLLAGCDFITGASPGASGNAPATTASGDIDYAALGMTPDQVRMWEERGTANVATLEAASVLAGYPVATPDYIPEGFYRQENIMVQRLGGGLPADIKPASSPILVDTLYFLRGDDKVMFFVEQSNGKANVSGAQPAQICGLKGEKAYQPADPKRKYPSEILILAVHKGGYSFFMNATLAGPLDEATIEKVLCSINPD